VLADFMGESLSPPVWQVHGCPIANVQPFVQEVMIPGLMRLRLGALLMPTWPLSFTLRGRSRFSGGECSRMDCYRCLDTLLSHPRGVTWGSTACSIIGLGSRYPRELRTRGEHFSASYCTHVITRDVFTSLRSFILRHCVSTTPCHVHKTLRVSQVH